MGRFSVPEPSPPGRFSAGRFYVAPEEEWLPTASPLVQKRRKPDGTWETRPTPRPAPEPERLPGNLAASPAARAAAEQGRAPDLGVTDVSAPRGAWNPALGPPEGSGVPVRSPLGERLSADIASNAFGPFVGLAERAGAVPAGTREALREEALRLQEQALVADPEGGVGRAAAQAGRELLTSLPGPSLLLGPAAGKGGALIGRAAGLGRAGQTAAAVGAGAVEQGAENFFDTVDLPTRERLAAVALGAGLGLVGGVGDVRAGGRSISPAAPEPRASVVPTETVQPPGLAPDVPTTAVQPDRRSNLGLRKEVDDVLAALRLEQPDPARLAGAANEPVSVRPAGWDEGFRVPRPEPRGTAVTERGARIDFDYEVWDASSLVTSHDDTLRPNPVYPREVQPRDRARVASAAQVSRIEQRLDPELLGASPKVSDGAPFIGPDGVVESGNARSIAIRRAYLSASPQGEGYRDWLRDTAPRLGLDPSAIDAVPNPVLVRVRRTPVDRAAFAIEANESGLAAMSAAERAAADAQLLTPDMLAALRIPENGTGVNLQANRDFVRAFASRVNPAEQGALFDARGALSLEGERRIQNAILARAFGDPLAVAKLTEHADSNVRAVGSALVREAPRFARMRDGIAAGRLYPLDISEDVAAALRKLSSLREEGMQISDYLAQGALFGSDLTPEARGLLALFDANARSGSRVGEILGRYVAGVEALGDPGQARLFGQSAVPSKLDLLRTVAPDDQRVLLAQADAAFVAEGGITPPVNGGEALLPPPRPGAARGMRPPQGDLPGIEAPSSSPGRMSTKGIENVAGMQDELADVVRANRDEIYAARGEPVPVSRWHDAEGLAQKTGLTPDDYLKMAPGRTLNPDEGALGKHYLGGMKQQARDLEQRIARGEVDDMAAAVAEKNARNRDVVRMMAVLQGQGSSEAGRYMRMLQEALDPYQLAETPKEKLQLALLKHYGAKNADEAAAIEAKAVARIQRLTAREARQAKRAATAEELSAEFGSLLSELDSLTRRPRGMGGGPVPLDPELVGVIGKMAANRVRAGVVAVEELADAVYMAVRDRVEGISRDQVKAAIVEHALAKPAKLTREEARVRQAEAAARKSIEKMEARVAAGGAKSPRPAPVTSPALEKLRARQAELREQLAALRAKPATDPAVRRLKTAEAAATRRVRKLEEKLAAGPTLPGAKPAAAESERLAALRQRAADLRSKIEKDPRHSLVQRYRELLDEDTVEMISKLPDPLEQPDALVNFLRQMEKPTFRDFRTTYWLNSILSGTKTAARNLAGNFAKIGVDTAMRPIAAAVEQYALAPLQGRVPARLVRETLPATAGVFRGIPDGLKRFAFVMKNGYDPGRLVSELTGEAAQKWQEGARLPLSPFLLSQNRAVRAVGVPLTMPSRILEATDALFKTMASTSEGYAWATRTAIQEGAGDVPARVAQLLQEQPEEMIKAQVLAAQRATYQDPMSWVGNTASAIRRGPPGADKLAEGLRAKGGLGNRAAAALVQAPATIGQHLIPFIHVSDRVAAGVTDFIPGSKPFKLAGLVAEGSPEAADLIARQAVGAAFGLLGLAWAAEGKLVGAAPKDEKLRNDFYAEGKQPYSLLVGGQWVPIRDALGPLAGPLVAAAAYQDHVQVGADPTPAIVGMTLASAKYMLDASYMHTLQEVISAVEDGGEGKMGRGITSAGARVVGGYVPFSGLVRNAATAHDPRVVEKEGFVDELKAGIPGLREELPARIGTLGEELRISTGSAGGFSPIVPTENKVADPGLAEDVERLRHTVARRRTEINRAVGQIKDARKAKDAARVRELAAGLPGASDRVQGDAALARVRGLEQQLRKLRADVKILPDRKRAREIALQKQMLGILSKALQRMGGSS